MIDIRNKFKRGGILELYENEIFEILSYSYVKIKQETCSYLNEEIPKNTKIEDEISYKLYGILKKPRYEKLIENFSINFKWESKQISKGKPDFEILIFFEGEIKTYSFIEAKFLKKNCLSCSNYIKEGMLRFDGKYYNTPFGIGFMLGYFNDENKIEEIKPNFRT
jgi:hypothetical protein